MSAFPGDGTAPRRALERWAGPAAVAATFALLAAWTWGAWADPLIDFGRELYLPWQIACGKALYRDLASLFGPFSPYFNAGMFKLFGVSLLTLEAVNLLLLAGATALLYGILRRATGTLGAATGCVVALAVFAFGRYEVGCSAFNFVCPYSHSATHGLIFGLAAVWAMGRYHGRPTRGALAAAGICLGLSFLTKGEMFVAAFAATVAAFLLAAWAHGFSPRRAARAAALLGAAAALPAFGAWALLSCAMPPGEALRGALGSWAHTFNAAVLNLPFYRIGMGTDDVRYSLAVLIECAGLYAVLLGAGAAAALKCRAPGPGRWLVAAALFAAPGVLLLWPGEGVRLFVARPWPLFLAALAAGAVARFAKTRRSPELGARAAATASLAVFALALLSKMALNSRTYHYGFVLALPAGALLAAALTGLAPEAIRRAGGFGGGFRAMALSAVAVVVLIHLGATRANLAFSRAPAGRGADAFRTHIRGAEILNFALDAVGDHAPPSATLAVLPEGAMANYLTRRANPTPYVTFLGVELLAFGEARMTRAYQEHPPDYVLLIGRDTSEYGTPFFGRDYGRELNRWIMAEYRPVTEVGGTRLEWPNAFGFLLMERRQSAAP